MVGMKRRSFLLLEMMIAMAIMAGAIAMLFSGFYSAIHNKNKVKNERERVLGLQRLKLRFEILFKDVIDVKEISQSEYYVKYQAGIDPDFKFRGERECILNLTKKTLTLTTWPEEGNPRYEVIAENITSLSFEFFDEAEGQFKPTYPKKKPPMMKIVLNGNPKETLPSSYELPPLCFYLHATPHPHLLLLVYIRHWNGSRAQSDPLSASSIFKAAVGSE